MGSYSTIARRRASGLQAVTDVRRPGSNGVNLPRPLFLWLLRVAWVTLPLTAGPAAAAATRVVVRRAARRGRGAALGRVGGRTARRRSRRVRITLTALRVIAPAFVDRRDARRDRRCSRRRSRSSARWSRRSCARCSRRATTSRPQPRTRSRTATSSASRCACRRRCSSARSPARVSSSTAGVVAPVLLLADGRDRRSASLRSWSAPRSSYVLSRSLDSLSRRWAVLVPAGFVVVDPLTLADPVALPARAHARTSRPRPGRRSTGESSTSASAPAAGSVSARLRRADRADPGRRGSTRRRDGRAPSEILVAVARRDEMLRLAAARRLPVAVTGQVAIPPPTSTSPS